MTDSSPGLISILRSALNRLRDESTGDHEDPALLKFKQRILRSLAQLEVQRGSLRAPDVIVPEASPHIRTEPSAPEAPSNPHAIAPDSVIVLVARRPRKPHTDDDDSSGSGHSSAA